MRLWAQTKRRRACKTRERVSVCVLPGSIPVLSLIPNVQPMECAPVSFIIGPGPAFFLSAEVAELV